MVDYRQASVRPEVGALVAGRYVQVRGTLAADGTLMADTVRVLDGRSSAEAELKGNILGLDASNNMISVASTNAISRYNPASYTGNCNTLNMFSNTSLSSALRLSPMRSATIGIPEGFLVTESGGKLSAQTSTNKGPQIKSFTDGLAAQGLTLTSASVLIANQAAGDLLVFSASSGSGKPSDLYVLTNKTPGELWLKYVGYGNQPTP